MEMVERGGEGRQISWQFYPLSFLMRLIFPPRPRALLVQTAVLNSAVPRCQGLQGSRTRDAATTLTTRSDWNGNGDTRRYVISGIYRFSIAFNERPNVSVTFVDISPK